jgi:hypothetical protein
MEREHYTFLELFFSGFKWVRRRSGGIWVNRIDDPAFYGWVKFSKKDLNEVKAHCRGTYLYEDYTARLKY